MKKLFIILTAIIGVMIASVSYSQNFIKVTRTNQEQTINLSTDQVLEIQLPGKVSTGYVWLEADNSANKAHPNNTPTSLVKKASTPTVASSAHKATFTDGATSHYTWGNWVYVIVQ